jgi:phospho-N-acetylmuramoyl-pentapeptide-transferase
VIAIFLQEQLFFAIIGGLFIIEALSSIIQRVYFRHTRLKYGTGKRLFLRAPLHHHFELKGISEEKIVIRFYIVAMLFLVIGLSTLKLR